MPVFLYAAMFSIESIVKFTTHPQPCLYHVTFKGFLYFLINSLIILTFTALEYFLKSGYEMYPLPVLAGKESLMPVLYLSFAGALAKVFRLNDTKIAQQAIIIIFFIHGIFVNECFQVTCVRYKI